MSTFPENYITNNNKMTKYLNVVVEVEDSPYLFSLVNSQTLVRYGDPGVEYGAGYVYGGLRDLTNVKPYLSIESNLKLSQKIEPEMGRGSASSMALSFVDVNGFMTRFITPGQILNEPIGGKQVKVWLGYAQSSWPEDYFVVYRGYITGTRSLPTMVTLDLQDANFKTKQQICSLGKTTVRSIAHSFSPSDVNDTSDIFTISNHEFAQGYIVQFSGSPPSPLNTGTNYYIVNPTTNTFQVSATLNGGAINLLSTGSGTMGVALTDLGPYATVIPLNNTEGFSVPILGPDGTYDSGAGSFVQIDDESMQYTIPSQITSNTITVVRGARDTTAANHAVEAAADNWIEITGNIIDVSLKLMLSGWNGPWIENVAIRGFGYTDDPGLGILPNAIVLPDGKNAIENYGLAAGDYLTVTGSASNDGVYTVSGFTDARGYPNNVIIINGAITPEASTAGVMSIRSQYDTFPINWGTKLRPIDVDVTRWQVTKRNFAFQPDCTFRNLIKDPISCKDFIENEFMKPGGLYLITRFGRISVSATKPPIAGETLVILNKDSVINPQNILVNRSSTNRRFFNNVQYFYDTNDQGEQKAVTALIDSTSITDTDLNLVLPINANGLKTDLGADTFINRRGGYILRRYGNGAIEISMETNWKAGSLIQVSDTVAVYDNGGLQISNLVTGERDLGSQLFEVINWDLDIKSGVSKLTLLTQLDYQITDRFAGIAPSSVITTGGTTTRIPLLVSYGGRYPGQEWKKYEPIVGERITIHSSDYSFSEEVTLVGFDPVSPNILLITALSMAPVAGWIVDCGIYPSNTDATDQAKEKLLFCFLDPTLTITSGTSTTVFDVSLLDAAQIPSNAIVMIHNDDYSRQSAEVNVQSVVGTTVTLAAAISFTPQAGDKVEFVGFLDLGGAYRLL
jgi:hypothetical protein